MTDIPEQKTKGKNQNAVDGWNDSKT